MTVVSSPMMVCRQLLTEKLVHFFLLELTKQGSSRYPSHKALMGEMTDTGELIQGTLEMLILKALVRGPLHGYSVAEWIQHTSQQMLKVEEGALYPALHRMELRGLLKSKWGISENNRKAKFYDLTAEGRRRLDAESQRWARLSSAVAFVMQAS
jgi:PadR family transcriptional regulator, regulatory protein PadR